MVSHPENGSDSPIGSNRDRGRDTKAPEYGLKGKFRVANGYALFWVWL